MPQPDLNDNANPLLTAALAYAARGWHVFPCHTPTVDGCSCLKRTACTDRGKHPRTKNGLKDATTDPGQIRRWWQQMWPEANIGICTGAVSDFVVLDVDAPKGGVESLVDLEKSYRALPETVQQLTGRGQHYFFAYSGVHVKNGVETLGPGLDIRGDGGYVISAPSLHETGRRYAWEVLHEPDDTPLAPMPDWLLALCQTAPWREGPNAGDPIPDGQRNDTLFRLGCSFRARGCTEAVIFAALREMNATQCEPPLSEGAVAKIAAQCAQYQAGSLGHDVYQHRNGQTPGPEPTDPYACPELPASATIDAHAAAEASLFLNEYEQLSTKWAPRAYKGFHATVALFVLSTLAARRIKIAFGAGQYTSLYLALAGRTGLFTKTTAADIGVALIQRVAPYLLAADDATPQALIRAMAGVVSPAYPDMDGESKLTEQRRLAFAGQRGWFYEEWGQHLDAMMDSHGGNMALFRSILRRMDDQKDHYLYETISRGVEALHKPYLSLLCNVTPMDLQPFAKKDSKLWRDGFMARFAFSTPDDEDTSDEEYPREEFRIPAKLITELHNWHVSLGIPDCHIEPDVDGKGKEKGTFHVVRKPLPETTYTLAEEVWRSYYAYDKALRQLMKDQHAVYLDGSYTRFPAKALRIAALFSSLHSGGKRIIWPKFWALGQHITEQWRLELHRLVRQIHAPQEEPGERRTLEDALIQQVRQRGAQTLRELGLFHKTNSREEIALAVKTLVGTGEFIATGTARTVHYELATASIKKV